jgi:hypothetical protein
LIEEYADWIEFGKMGLLGKKSKVYLIKLC